MQYRCCASGGSMYMISASLSALAHAGCPATSLRRSCVGICLVIRRKRCTSTVAPGLSAKAVRTLSMFSCLLRILLRNNVGWSVSRHLCDPTLSGPVLVTVVRPCLSVYVVRQPAFNTKCGHAWFGVVVVAMRRLWLPFLRVLTRLCVLCC